MRKFSSFSLFLHQFLLLFICSLKSCLSSFTRSLCHLYPIQTPMDSFRAVAAANLSLSLSLMALLQSLPCSRAQYQKNPIWYMLHELRLKITLFIFLWLGWATLAKKQREAAEFIQDLQRIASAPCLRWAQHRGPGSPPEKKGAPQLWLG